MAVSNGAAAAIAVAGALSAAVATATVMRHTDAVPAQGADGAPAERVQRIHERGAAVMPFALDRTEHVFEMTDSGGIQDVVARDRNDTATIQLIRQHLAHEARMFRQGDFRDPMSLHGAGMPGVAALAAGAQRVRIGYATLPDGARIVYVTADPALVTAVHRWFGAQLSDHAGDATYR